VGTVLKAVVWAWFAYVLISKVALLCIRHVALIITTCLSLTLFDTDPGDDTGDLNDAGGGGDAGDGGGDGDGDVDDGSGGAVARPPRRLASPAADPRPRRHFRRDASTLKDPRTRASSAKEGAASGAGGGGSGSGGGGLGGGDGGEGGGSGGGGDSDSDDSDGCECRSALYSCITCRPDVRGEGFYVTLEETGGQLRAGSSTRGLGPSAEANKGRRSEAVEERRRYIIKRAQAMRVLVQKGGFFGWRQLGRGQCSQSSSRHALNFHSKAIPGEYDTTDKAFDAWWLVHASGWVEELI